MKLSARIQQQEQKTALDSLYDLRNIARGKGIASYVLNGRLYVWRDHVRGYEEVTTEEDLCQ